MAAEEVTGSCKMPPLSTLFIHDFILKGNRIISGLRHIPAVLYRLVSKPLFEGLGFVSDLIAFLVRLVSDDKDSGFYSKPQLQGYNYISCFPV